MRRIVRLALIGAFALGGSETAAAQSFGRSLAVSGQDVLVGEPGHSARSGLVYVYRKRGTVWAERARLEPSDAQPSDGFGQTMLVDGEMAFVTQASQGARAGAVYVFQRDRAGAWRETARIAAPAAREGFGASLALIGDMLLVGAPARDSARGSVYQFRRSGTAWSAAGALTPSDARPGDRFGQSLVAADGRVIVGSPGRGRNGGVAWVFGETDGQLREQSRLAPTDTTANNRFGQAIAAAGSDIFVGSPGFDRSAGAVFHFQRDSLGRWQERTILRPFDRAPFKQFGGAVALDGSELWVGAPTSDQFQGRVYRIRRDASGAFTDVTKLGPEGARPNQFLQYGGSLAIAGGVALIGNTGDDDGAGAVLVYERSAQGAWAQRQRLASEPFSIAAVTGGQRECAGGAAAVFTCEEVDLQSFLPIAQIGGGRGIRLNDIWGWVDPVTRREYALVGRTNGTSFVDVTNPNNPVFIGDLPKTEGSNNAAWRDIKVYNNHAFIVADGAGRHGMQVFDLTQLRGVRRAPATFQPLTTYRNINSAHNIVINEESGFAYAVGASAGGETCGGGLHMIDIRNPANPTFAGCFADPQTGRASTGYSHDAQCVTYRGPDTRYRGREICIGSNETAISIADVTDRSRPVALARSSYPNVGYSHQGWFTEDQRYFLMDDELDELAGSVTGTRTLVWDLQDLTDPVLVREFIHPVNSSDHNLYIRGRYAYLSNYASGLRILDVSDPTNPRTAGFFDTFPWGEDAPGFNGTWSNYPYFPSGNIVVTGIGEGLFVLRHRSMTPIP
jgi:choice-of-anchor B domain-containing protein